MKPVTLNTIPHKSYTFKGGSTLIDGLCGYELSLRALIGFYGTDMNVTPIYLSLRRCLPVFVKHNVEHRRCYLWYNRSEGGSFSEDGKNFRRVAFEDFPVVEKGTKMQSRKDSVSFDKVKPAILKS